jgi:hypothetical protein
MIPNLPATTETPPTNPKKTKKIKNQNKTETTTTTKIRMILLLSSNGLASGFYKAPGKENKKNRRISE